MESSRNAIIAAGLLASLSLSAAPMFGAAAAVAGTGAARAMSAGAPDRSADSRQSADVESADKPANASAITAIGNATEAIAEAETTGSKATAAANSAIALWVGARQKLAENGASQNQLAAAATSIERLREAVETHADLRRSANDVTGALAPLFAFNGDKVPAAIHTLDYLGRSIALDVHDGNWSRVASDTANLRVTWNGVRSRALGRAQGPLEAARYEKMLAALKSATDALEATATTLAAKHTLDGVDALEKTFGA